MALITHKKEWVQHFEKSMMRDGSHHFVEDVLSKTTKFRMENRGSVYTIPNKDGRFKFGDVIVSHGRTGYPQLSSWSPMKKAYDKLNSMGEGFDFLIFYVVIHELNGYVEVFSDTSVFGFKSPYWGGEAYPRTGLVEEKYAIKIANGKGPEVYVVEEVKTTQTLIRPILKRFEFLKRFESSVEYSKKYLVIFVRDASYEFEINK